MYVKRTMSLEPAHRLSPEDFLDAISHAGFAKFNSYPHLCLDLEQDPEGMARVPWGGKGFTIAVRTPKGKLVTFSFVPGEDGKEDVECVDIFYHGASVQRWALFGTGKDAYNNSQIHMKEGRAFCDPETPVTLASLLLSSDHQGTPGEEETP